MYGSRYRYTIHGFIQIINYFVSFVEEMSPLIVYKHSYMYIDFSSEQLTAVHVQGTHTYTHTHTHTHSYTHTQIHTHSHLHTHTHKHTQCYSDSLELFNAAVSLLMSKTTAVSAKVRQSLEDWLQEQVLVVQLLATNKELVSGGGAILKQR